MQPPRGRSLGQRALEHIFADCARHAMAVVVRRDKPGVRPHIRVRILHHKAVPGARQHRDIVVIVPKRHGLLGRYAQPLLQPVPLLTP